jgi:hypothetical protein
MEDNPAAAVSGDSGKRRSKAQILESALLEKKRLVHYLGYVDATWTLDGDLGLVRRECGTWESGGRHSLGEVVTDVDDTEEWTPGGKRRLRYAELRGGAMLEIEDGREVSWPVDLAARRRSISRCGEGWHLLVDETGQLRPTPYRCKDRACPCCSHTKVGRLAHHWVPVLEAAVSDEAEVRLLTFTQLVRQEPGALVLPHERDRYQGDSPPGEVRRAVGGESMRASYLRWRDTFESVREDRATKERWRWALGGYLYGIEWTLRSKKERGSVVPRWHCHGHVLVVTPKGRWKDERALWNQLRRDWCKASPGSRAGSQDCRRVLPRGEQTWSGALLETLKYPVKTATMTVAAMVEAYASLRGLRPHHVGGAFHHNSKAAQEGSYRRWLDASPPTPQWPRLQVRGRPDGVWEDYSGQYRGEDVLEWSADARAWRAPAEGYYQVLQQARVSYEVHDRALLDADA